MKRNQSGFTLIEIAIVLVIIGLLLGGVLKGQELINSAKVKNLATDFRNIPVYVYGYQDKFRALPGDDVGAGSHVAAATVATGASAGNGVIDGKWDEPANYSSETQLFWMDVRLANLAAGPTASGADLIPTNSFGGAIGITSGNVGNNPDTSATPIQGTYIICSAAILGKFAAQLDIQMDDGNPNTGSMRTYTQIGRGSILTPAVPVASTGQVDPSSSFVVCMGV